MFCYGTKNFLKELNKFYEINRLKNIFIKIIIKKNNTFNF